MSINEDNLTTGAEGFESGATNIDDNLGFDNNNDDDDDDDDDGEGGAFGGEDDAEAWDLDDELDIGDDDIVNENVPEFVTTENEIGDWLRNAKTPATYVAAGGFEQAASLLNKQIGVVNFEPLRTRFNQVYGASNYIYQVWMNYQQ